MATAASSSLLPFIRATACAILFRALRLSYVVDRRWPAVGSGIRRPLLFLWANVTAALSDRFRSRLRGESVAGTPSGADRCLGPGIAPEDIGLVHCDNPVVSVIIPTYGQLSFTLRCLASIHAYFPVTPIEIIIIDDAFPGLQAEALARIKGIRLLRNSVNRGFLRTCNAAAQAARGEFLLFLNNDTEVRSGWLDSLVAVFACHSDAGLVGSKLIGDDARLQEAGSILWKDGSAGNYGWGCDPDAPEFNYLREVDYCSGASLMVRRQVFLSLSGFDEKYTPAYYEDADLAMRLRRIGLRTFYQPRSEVMHHGGVSHGRDVCFGIKSCQVTNQVTFFKTWQDVLAREHFPAGMHMTRARERARDRQVVLLVDRDIPQTDHDDGSCAGMAVIRSLLASGMVVKFWPLDLCRTPVHCEALQDIGVEVLYAPHQTSLAEWLKTTGADLDVLLFGQPDVAEVCLPVVRSGTAARFAFYGDDIHFRGMAPFADPNRDANDHGATDATQNLEVATSRDANSPGRVRAAVAMAAGCIAADEMA